MKVAIIDGNILAAIGLKQILSTVMPMMHIDIFGTMAELHANTPDTYFHFFVNTTIVLQDMAFFSTHRHKTIVLTTSTSDATQLTGFHSLCTSQSGWLYRMDKYSAVPLQRISGIFIQLVTNLRSTALTMPVARGLWFRRHISTASFTAARWGILSMNRI